MSKYRVLIRILLIAIFSFVANSFYLMKSNIWLIPVVILLFFFVNTFSGFLDITIKRWRLKICNHGVECLSVFYMSLIISMIYHIIIIFALPWDWLSYLLSVLVCTLTHTILFWDGIICVYRIRCIDRMKHRKIIKRSMIILYQKCTIRLIIFLLCKER